MFQYYAERRVNVCAQGEQAQPRRFSMEAMRAFALVVQWSLDVEEDETSAESEARRRSADACQLQLQVE